MRILDVGGFKYVTGPTIKDIPGARDLYDQTMATIDYAYNGLLRLGVAVEDARGVLPTNICTNIVAKYNLRTLAEMMSARSSSRTQREYRDGIDDMYEEVLKVHPWAHHFLNSKKKQAADKLDEAIQYLDMYTDAQRADLIKQIDILRKS